MQIQTLENTSVEEIANTFNKAFKNYFVRVNLTVEILEQKLYSEDVDLSLSAGLFNNGGLVGFILHGARETNGIKTAYNAGTGIVEEFRGQHFTSRLYEFILPKLKKSGINKCVLEVISENTPAIKSYKKTGFVVKRNLECFQGVPKAKPVPDTISFAPVPINEWLSFQEHWDWEPSWQHANQTIARSNTNQILGIYDQGKLKGYAIFNPETGRVLQFCIKWQNRQQGYGAMLFSELGKIGPGELSVINVDGNSESTLAFLGSIGLKKSLRQYAMELAL